MCKALDDIFNDGIAQGITQGIARGITQGVKQGIEQGQRAIVINMNTKGVSIENIVKYTGLEENKIKQITRIPKSMLKLSKIKIPYLKLLCGSGSRIYTQCKRGRKRRSQRGEINMCKVLDDLYNDGMARGIAQGIDQGVAQGVPRGIEQGQKAIVINMNSEGMSIENIMKYTGLEEDKIKQIIENSKTYRNDYRI